MGDRLKIEVLNTGSELLLGQVTNTHVNYFARQLAGLGLRISRQTTVPDGEVIAQALGEALARAEVVLVTGGLGPTSDDVTREAVAGHFGLPLEHHPEIEREILGYFERRGIRAPALVRVQAMVPQGAVVMPNRHGTAPGLYVGREGRHVFCLPGPPRELYPMFEQEVLPRLREIVPGARPLNVQVWRVHGLGESRVQELVEERLRALGGGLEIGYCARPGEVDLRLVGDDRGLVQSAAGLAREILGEAIYAAGEETMEEVVVREARARGCRIALAESCTGGFTAHRVTNVPGASAVLDRAWVTYSNEAKTAELGVPAGLIEAHGAVSAPVAEAMVRGALERSTAVVAAALTGLAGPDPGTKEKPAGLVYVALGRRGPGGTAVSVEEKRLVPARQTFKTMASQTALDLIRRALMTF